MKRVEALFDDVLVQKYGGSSVATPEKILAVAGRIGDALKRSAHVVVAVSAMGKTTDQLIAMAREVSPSPRGREMDLLLASGEQIAVSMLGLALQARGIAAVSLTANQCGIHTDGSFNKARVRAVETARLVQELGAGRVVIVAGFQGVTVNDDITTLGRGGGDITGAVLAAALNASSYENCTDVDGVYTADPRIVTDARRIPHLSLRRVHRAVRCRCQGPAPASRRDLHAIQSAHPRPSQLLREARHVDP